MAHLITKLSTRAKLSQLAKTKLEKEIQINQNIHPEIQGLRDEIQMNEALVIKQGFFAAAKARHQERMMQVEKFIRKGVEL